MNPSDLVITVVDMHTAGEPVRIVVDGFPALTAPTLLGRRREALERHDRLRTALMLEPRGHDGMYGVLLTPPTRPDVVASVLFTHGEGYSTMCGHATVALGRFMVESGRVPRTPPLTRFAIEAPCGVLRLTVEEDGRASFEGVPAFVLERDRAVTLDGLRPFRCDIAYGGAFYAILPSSRMDLPFESTPVETLKEAAGRLTNHLRATAEVRHPSEPDLGFLYGTILTDDAQGDAPSCNLCVFAEEQIDRSPTGSGVTARMALDHAKGLIGAGETRTFRGVSGEPFTGRVLRETPEGVVVEVAGRGFVTGESRFLIDPEDPLRDGFSLPRTFGDLR